MIHTSHRIVFEVDVRVVIFSFMSPRLSGGNGGGQISGVISGWHVCGGGGVKKWRRRDRRRRRRKGYDHRRRVIGTVNWDLTQIDQRTPFWDLGKRKSKKKKRGRFFSFLFFFLFVTERNLCEEIEKKSLHRNSDTFFLFFCFCFTFGRP